MSKCVQRDPAVPFAEAGAVAYLAGSIPFTVCVNAIPQSH